MKTESTESKDTVTREQISLRAKAMIIGALIGFVISSVSGTLTWSAARSYLLNQRESSARVQSFAHARLVANSINGGMDPFEALSSIRSTATGYRSLLLVDGEWLSSGSGISARFIPDSLISSIDSKTPAIQRATYSGTLAIFTAYPISTTSGSSANPSTVVYVGVSPLSELSNTLWSISRALMFGTGIATLGGLIIGYWLSRRVMGPLRDLSRTAVEISHGNLDARVTPPSEPDLAMIATSFNSMADDLQLRLEAESRFAAQAAHELRSPLTAIKGAADLVTGRQDQLPSDLVPTLRVLNDKISYFERLLQDLLLLGRQASGVESANLTSRSPHYLFTAIVSHLSIPHDRLHFMGDLEDIDVMVDVQALTRVIDNLARNAEMYGSGLAALSVIRTPMGVIVHIDDSGPGFSSLELESVLQPFQRGRLSHGTEGAGLGLSIAKGLLKSMGSTLMIDSSPTGGARCSFSLALAEGELQ